MKKHLMFLAVGWLMLAGQVFAEVKPNTLCSEGMVLQQKSQAAIWGTAAKDEKVTVSFRGKSASATADGSGKWLVRIETGAAGGPFELSIEGSNKIAYKNVLVGEVWVCSGQSNMEWSVNACDEADKKFATGAPHNPLLRMFTVKRNPQVKPQTDVSGAWIEAKPETVGPFSATAYFFGRDLQQSLKVPVGLIHTSWGGTRVQAWTRKEALDGNTYSKHEHENFTKALEAYGKDSTKAKNPLGPNSPSVLYNGMIAPVLNYAIKGAIWYQGESNASEAYKYRTLFPLMIENWRKDFGQGDLPFYFVQLAPFQPVSKTPGPSTWAELREAQSLTLKLPNTGQAVITDYGNEYDIHPTPKRPVGERLSLAARALTYGEKVVYSGPVYQSLKVDGNKAVLTFDHVGMGLVAKKLVPTKVKETKAGKVAAWRVDPSATDVELEGFTVCGKDQVFHPAKAVIQGSQVIVTSPQVEAPVAVRYGWAQHPICGLFNREGLPASPFRTDSFPGMTQPK